MDETRQNLSCTVTPDVRFSDVLLPEHAKTQDIHRPSIAGPSTRPNGPVLAGCRRSGTVGTSGCGSVPAALGRRWFWSALHVVNSSNMLFTVITLFLYFSFFQGVKNPPSTSRFEINNTFSAAFKLNKSLEPVVNLSDKQVVLNPLVPNASPLSSMLKAEHPSSMGVKSSGCDPPLQSEGCDLVSGLCALFPVISLTGDHDDAENPAVSSSPVVSGDIKGGSVVAAHTSLTGSGRQPGPGGVGARSDALLGAPPDKGGVLSGSEFSVADFNRFGGTPPPSGRVIAELDTDLPPIQLTTLTSDPELGAAPSTGRSSSQYVNTLVKPGFSDSVWEPPSFLGIKYSWLQFSGQTMFLKLATCLYLILNMARFALTPVTQPSLDHSFSEPPSPTPPGLWTSEHLLFRHDSDTAYV
nr:uncharacterized protein LOC129156094 [Nothobranchius furzeri]